MAVFKHGPLVADIRGKLGDNVFTRSQGGPTIRTVGTWTQPDTDSQVLTREAMAAIAAAWSSTLTNAQRSAWRHYAHANPRPDRWGRLTQTSGYLSFIRHNFHAYIQATALQFPNAPTAPPIHPPTIAIAIRKNGAVAITGALVPDVTGDYIPSGTYQGTPTWTGATADGPWSIWKDGTTYLLSQTIGYSEAHEWYGSNIINASWAPYGDVTGNPASAWSAAASLATLTMPPSNYNPAPAGLTLHLYSARPLNSGRAYYSGPWSWLCTIEPPASTTAGSVCLEWTWPVHAVGAPYVWPAGNTGHTLAYAVAQDVNTGAISTKRIITPTMVPP
jgi:hypothetical protein